MSGDLELRTAMFTSRKSSPARGTKCTAFFSPRSVDLGHTTKDTFFPPRQAEESESQTQSRVGASTHFLASPSTSTALPAFVLSAFFFFFSLVGRTRGKKRKVLDDIKEGDTSVRILACDTALCTPRLAQKRRWQGDHSLNGR